MSKVLVDRELLEYLADLGDEAIERMGSYLAEKHGEQKYVDEARAILAKPVEAQGGLRAIHALILNALDRDAEEGKTARGEMAAELRAALAAKEA